ncbi:hypothetical protein [Myxosarcina sp. GI1(2024)]
MTNTTLLTRASDLTPEDYCVLGVATCFLREEGEVREIKVIEPIPSAALEALVKEIPTSYQAACAKTLGEIMVEDKIQLPAEFPQDANLCDHFEERLLAAARTYKSRPEAKKHLPLGTLKQDFNYSLERKRVLNATNIVRVEDNIKQHEHTHKVL